MISWPESPAEVGRLELLTAVEEVDLARTIEVGLLAAERLAAGGVTDPITARDLRLLVRAGEDAFDRMILANLRLVHFWARRRIVAGATGGLSLDDLVSEGTLGLIRGVQKFDFTLGFKFSTYSSWWIRQRMQRAAAANTAAAVPAETQQAIARLYAAQEALAGTFGRPATEQELADDLETTVRRVRELQRICQRAVSLDRTANLSLGTSAGSGTTLGDLLPDPTGDVAGEAIAADMHLQVHRLLRTLTDRQRRVLTLRFGLGGQPAMTAEETAAVLRVPAAMVREALDRALEHLRTVDGVDELHAFLEAA